MAALFYALDQVLEHPTGGLLAWLVAHPAWYLFYSFGDGIIHNLISAAFPPGGSKANS